MPHNLKVLTKQLLLSMLIGLPGMIYFRMEYLVTVEGQAVTLRWIVLSLFYIAPILSYLIYSHKLQFQSSKWKRILFHLIFFGISIFVYLLIVQMMGHYIVSHIA